MMKSCIYRKGSHVAVRNVDKRQECIIMKDGIQWVFQDIPRKITESI